MKRYLSKILTSILLLLLVSFFLSPSTSFAQTKTQTNNAATLNTNPDVPNNLHNWTQSVMIEVMSSLTCQLTGVDPINPKQSCLGADQKTGKIGFLPSQQTGGAIGFMGNMITALYTPPLHTSDYFQSLAQNFGITKKTYAATSNGGTGFQSLSPLINIWAAFRNIVYLFLVIVFVVIGLAIMLRVKIDPRTVMSIQNQIPKIIVGILAVTFSFAIAGFLIDMMWVIIYLVYGIFIGIPGVSHLENFNPSIIQGQNVLQIAGHISTLGIGGLATKVAWDGSDIIKGLLGIAPTAAGLNPFNGDVTSPADAIGWLGNLTNLIGFGFNLNPVSWLMNAVSIAISFFVGFQWLHLPPINATVLGVGGSLGWLQNALPAFPAMLGVYAGSNAILRAALPFLIIYLIVLIALFSALFKLWFALITAYVQVLLAIVLAPFWIIGGIVPGSPISLGGWFRTIGANLLAFPATLGMFMLGRVFIDGFEVNQKQGQFVPPFIGNSGSDNTIGSLIGVGIILMTPNVINMLKAALKAPKTETGLGAILAPGMAVPGRATSGVGGLAFGSAVEKGLFDKSLQDRSAIGRVLRLTGIVK